MINDSVAYKVPLQKMANWFKQEELVSKDLVISNSGWESFDVILGFLQPFKIISEYVSGDSYPTCSSVFPLYVHAIKHCNKYIVSTDNNNNVSSINDVLSHAALEAKIKFEKYLIWSQIV